MIFATEGELERLRREFPAGCRVVLDEMDDPYTKIPAGAQGVCRGVDDAGNIMVFWDCGSGLSVAYGADRAHRVASEAEVKESLDWLGKRQRDGGRTLPKMRHGAGELPPPCAQPLCRYHPLRSMRNCRGS